MNWKKGLGQPGVLAALGAAVLFGAGTPLAKLLLNSISPWLLAGLLYLGSGLGVAPFLGTLLAVAMGDPVTLPLLIAGSLMAVDVWLHLTEHHEHEHRHETLEHEHEHVHDEHHQHEHDKPVAPGTKHRHRHQHEPLIHIHPHFPDAHHRHDH
ncbi:MAG: hypothetical protein WA173_07545 [Pseudomonas sp.]|uniref:hypothetical protein n=1 Tax=Pseudomonas sp. TaxID=306 RepID=UPI003BB78B6A